MLETARILKEHGAQRISVGVVHGVFCGDAVERIKNCPHISEVVATNSVATPDKVSEKITILSCAELLAKTIRSVHTGEPLTPIFSEFYYTNV